MSTKMARHGLIETWYLDVRRDYFTYFFNAGFSHFGILHMVHILLKQTLNLLIRMNKLCDIEDCLLSPISIPKFFT